MKFDKKYISGKFPIVVAIIFLIAMGIVFFMVKTMVVDKNMWISRRHKAFENDSLVVKPMRGNILSDDGQLMASSLPDYKVFIDFMSGLSRDAIKTSTFSHQDSLVFLTKDSLFTGKGEYPTYLACHLFTENEVLYVPWSGWMDDRFPKITQEGGDGDENLGYIANMRDTATAGFKYFDCKGIKKVTIQTKGYATGEMEIRTAWDGESLGSIPIGYANVWHYTEGDITIPDGINSLYFTFKGTGHLQFASFILD